MRPLLALLLLCPLGACISPQTGAPDWPAMTREARMAAEDLESVSAIALASGEPELAEALSLASSGAELLHARLVAFQAGELPPDDLWAAAQAVLDELSAFAASHDDPRLQGAVELARIVSRRVQGYLEPYGAPGSA